MPQKKYESLAKPDFDHYHFTEAFAKRTEKAKTISQYREAMKKCWRELIPQLVSRKLRQALMQEIVAKNPLVKLPTGPKFNEALMTQYEDALERIGFISYNEIVTMERVDYPAAEGGENPLWYFYDFYRNKMGSKFPAAQALLAMSAIVTNGYTPDTLKEGDTVSIVGGTFLIKDKNGQKKAQYLFVKPRTQTPAPTVTPRTAPKVSTAKTKPTATVSAVPTNGSFSDSTLDDLLKPVSGLKYDQGVPQTPPKPKKKKAKASKPKSASRGATPKTTPRAPSVTRRVSPDGLITVTTRRKPKAAPKTPEQLKTEEFNAIRKLVNNPEARKILNIIKSMYGIVKPKFSFNYNIPNKIDIIGQAIGRKQKAFTLRTTGTGKIEIDFYKDNRKVLTITQKVSAAKNPKEFFTKALKKLQRDAKTKAARDQAKKILKEYTK